MKLRVYIPGPRDAANLIIEPLLPSQRPRITSPSERFRRHCRSKPRHPEQMRMRDVRRWDSGWERLKAEKGK